MLRCYRHQENKNGVDEKNYYPTKNRINRVFLLEAGLLENYLDITSYLIYLLIKLPHK